MNCDAQDLIEAARCFECIPKGELPGIKVYLLCQWANGGGGSSPPAAPVATDGTNILDVSFSANWNASAGATGYKLDVSTDAGFGAFVPGFNNLDVGNVLTYGVTGLTESTDYWFRVRAYNGSGTSADSNVIKVTTAAFTPSLITGLKLWLDAKVGVTEAGGVVQLWADQSGNGNNAAPDGSGGEDPPTYVAAGLNGMPTIDFNAAAAGGLGQALALANGITACPMSIFVVGKNDNDGTSAIANYMLTASSAETFYTAAFSDPTTMAWYDGTDNGMVQNAILDLTATIFETTIPNAAPPGQIRFYTKGVLDNDFVFDAAGPALGLSVPPIYIGSYAPGSSPFNGKISEMIVYNTVLSAANRQKVENYLVTKWAL